MTVLRPSGSTAVMALRREPPNSLDWFPTPPFATRALIEHVLLPMLPPYVGRRELKTFTVWEPACGGGHMAEVLAEYFGQVRASDVFDYGYGEVLDFLDPDVPLEPPLWGVITNPPFNVGVNFAERCIAAGVPITALLARTAWIEGQDRYARLFRDNPPTIMAPFVERVPIVKGRWDPNASTATSYAWFVWVATTRGRDSRLVLIPPCRKALTRPDDVRRFCVPAPMPLFNEAVS